MRGRDLRARVHVWIDIVWTCNCLRSVQVTLSGRDVDKGISVRTSGVQINAVPCSEAEGSVSIYLKWFIYLFVNLFIIYKLFTN